MQFQTSFYAVVTSPFSCLFCLRGWFLDESLDMHCWPSLMPNQSVWPFLARDASLLVHRSDRTLLVTWKKVGRYGIALTNLSAIVSNRLQLHFYCYPQTHAIFNDDGYAQKQLFVTCQCKHLGKQEIKWSQRKIYKRVQGKRFKRFRCFTISILE